MLITIHHEHLVATLREAYLRGFEVSAEGYNSEYPFSDESRDPEFDKAWVRSRDSTLLTLIAKATTKSGEQPC